MDDNTEIPTDRPRTVRYDDPTRDAPPQTVANVSGRYFRRAGDTTQPLIYEASEAMVLRRWLRGHECPDGCDLCEPATVALSEWEAA